MCPRRATSSVFLVLAAACGGSTPAGPQNPGPPVGAQLQIHTRAAALRVGETETLSVTVSGASGGDVTGTAALVSSNPAVFVIDNNRVIRAIGPGEASINATYQTLTQSIPQMVVAAGPTPNAGPSIASPKVRINEFRTSGPSGARDEFIELKNVSGAAVSLSGWSVALSTAAGQRESLGKFLPGQPSLGAGCYFLMAGSSGPNAYSSGQIAVGDFRWSSSSFDDNVGFALIDPQGRIVDQVGMRAGAVYKEGTPLAPLVGRSRERIKDSGNNAADFTLPAADSPRNRASACQ